MQLIKDMYTNSSIVNFKTAKTSLELLKSNDFKKFGKKFSTIHKATAKKQEKKQAKRIESTVK